ncbi:MAG: TonB-dependent siderophore receptor [Candidatus Andeanibacterium colombiense]|uniref:TonB-dependent siderophore receptor n=1 Tax=Candidatus Andeanibacterium colombiense TaxID=3121345 RepID=A0AAJ6BP27_9SPHN|nr:MAG: TonB-dependent siderophore receptor [Sphingomonadaceae bacterium]
MRAIASLLAAASVAAFTTTAAYAEDAADSPSTENSQASEILVLGQGNAPVTLGKSEQTIRELPQSVTVVSREQINLTNSDTLDDVLLQTPGLTLFGANEATYYARGFEIDTLQFDGVAIDPYSAAMTSPDTAIIERVEVLRGAAGLWQGAGSFGGAINLVRKHAQASGAYARATVDTEGAYRFEGDVSAALDSEGRFRVRAVGVYDKDNSFIDYVGGEKWLAYGAIDADLTPSTTLSAAISYQDTDDTPFPDYLPRYTNGDPLDVPRDTFLGATWNRRSVETTQLFGELTQRFGENWKLHIGINHIDSDRDSKTLQANGAVDPNNDLTNGRISRNVLSTKQTSIDANINGTFELFGREQEIQFGGNWRKLDDNLLNGSVVYGGINVETFDPAAVVEPDVDADLGLEATVTKQYGMFAALRLSPVDRLHVVLGGRLSWFETVYDFVYLPLPGVIDDHQEYKASSKFTPYAGLTYDITDSLSLYASYAEAFQPQNAQYKEGGFLPAITGENYEGGIKGSFLGDRLIASAAYFRVEQVNRAQEDPTFTCFEAYLADTPNRCYLPGGAVRSQGVELEISGRPMPNWLITGGYTYTDTKYLRDRDENGDPTADEGLAFASFTPKHMLRLWTNYRFEGPLSALSIGGSVNYQSKWTQSNFATYSQKGYALVDLYAGYDITPNLTLSANVTNLFDQTYFQSISSTAYGNRYGAPRTAMFTLRGKF